MKTRPIFSPAFKVEIAKLMVEQNYSIAQACAASGAGPSAVRRWKLQYLAELAGQTLPHTQAITPEQREISKLKQRIRDLEMDKEILKKASVLFAQGLR
jgi:transposase